MPRINPIFAMFDPIIFPIIRPVALFRAAEIVVKSSGADVAKDTTVNPTKIFGKPSDVAKLAAASERQSPALINAIIPTAMQMIRNMRCNKSLRSPKIEARISRMFCMMKKAETLHG